VRNPRDSRLRVVQPEVRNHRPWGKLVRLAQLRKLRECEQVAAVCYWVRDGDIEFLLVRTRGSKRWTFPKGSAEPGLTHAQAAALEAFEEAGVHGRIEESSFARYVRRKPGGGRKSAARSGETELVVNAHLCEVLRLSAPEEAKRHRTWFSVQEARRRLREGRESDEGKEFARVIDRAVARIQRSRAGMVVDVRPLQDLPRQKDSLQEVQFEAFAGAQGRAEQTSFIPNIHRQLAGMRMARVPDVNVPGRVVLKGEVLRFDAPREKNARVLGTGIRNG
jgi:8-oxo-dGTP pyrophosphatase MutT (NUDIX family)